MRSFSQLLSRGARAEDDSRERFDIVLVGPYPPPLGGVAAHVVRVVDVLEQERLNVRVVNHFGSRDADVVIAALKKNPLRYFIESRRLSARVIHYHHSRWPMLLAFTLGRPRSQSRLLITIHSLVAARGLKLDVPVLRQLTRWALARFDRIIVVNREIEAYLRERIGVDRILVLPAFVPPSAREPIEYPPEIGKFFARGEVILAAAYRIQPRKGERDLYGLDLAVDAFLALAPGRPELKLAVLLARAPQRRPERLYLERLRRRVEDAGFEARALWATELPLVPALRHNVVLVRPTREDGDSVSIREALEARVPVVASDVVVRPAGVMTFASGSAEDLRDEIEAALLELPHRRSRQAGSGHLSGDFVPDLLALYRECLDGSGDSQFAR